MKFILLLATITYSFGAWTQINKPSDDLFTINDKLNRNKDAQAIRNSSNLNYKKFVALDVNSSSLNPTAAIDFSKPKLITPQQALKALLTAESNKVVSLDHYSKYDPNNEGIGFCFGRAMFVHLYLAMNGIDRGSIKKAFIIGPMSNGSWQWHVTTIVQSRENGKEVWFAIDPVAGNVMTVEDWYKMWQNSSDDGKLRLFITDAHKFTPDSSGYDHDGLSDSFYHDYFNDLMKWFKKNDITNDLGILK